MTIEEAARLRETLESMFDHIEKKQNMVGDLQQIEKLHAEFASSAPPTLIHYLERRSYSKALEFLKVEFPQDEEGRQDVAR